MFHATISSESRGPLRFSGQIVPYDLQVLREHVLARRGRNTRVEVRLAPAEHQTLLRALGDIERRGVVLVLQP
jgi:hypothetical protein